MPDILSPGSGPAGIAWRPAEVITVRRVVLAGLHEPGVLVGTVVHDVVDDDPDAAGVGRREKRLEIGHGSVVGIDGAVVDGVVAVVARAIVDRHEPDARDSEIVVGGRVAVVEVVELARQALEVADPVAVAVVETAHEDLVEDRVVPPV